MMLRSFETKSKGSPLLIFGGQLIQQLDGSGQVVYPEDHQHPRRAGL
jgi:hypothetical protein